MPMFRSGDKVIDCDSCGGARVLHVIIKELWHFQIMDLFPPKKQYYVI